MISGEILLQDARLQPGPVALLIQANSSLCLLFIQTRLSGQLVDAPDGRGQFGQRFLSGSNTLRCPVGVFLG
jgi:hypothetical protein